MVTQPGADLRRVLAYSMQELDARFRPNGKFAWDRTIREDIVWRISIHQERDWPKHRGQIYAGILVPEISLLLPEFWPADNYGQHFANVAALGRTPTWSGFDEEIDLCQGGRGFFRRTDFSPQGIERRTLDLQAMLSSAITWLEPIVTLRSLADAIHADLTVPKAGHGGMSWSALGVVRWLDGDSTGAQDAWAEGETRTPVVALTRKEHRVMRTILEARDARQEG